MDGAAIIEEEPVILCRYGIDKRFFIGAGADARVYELDSGTLLKLYRSREGLVAEFSVLKGFYDSLEQEGMPFAVPRILEIEAFTTAVAVVEKRLPGRPMALRPDLLTNSDLMIQYLEVLSSLSGIMVNRASASFRLIDTTGIGRREGQDWNGFLGALIEEKIKGDLILSIAADLPLIQKKLWNLREYYLTPYDGALGLIHGDFHPGNVLLNYSGRIVGVIDFGSHTMFGDPLFDLATGAGYYQMYGQGVKKVRELLLGKASRNRSREEQAALYRYLITQAFLSADSYLQEGASIRDDGHYRWATAILGDEEYWERSGLNES